MTVRTRYAPSPTGLPHVGNIRTALFDWLLARHYGGQFILRIEDTDQARYTPGAVAGLLDSLRWLGIDWDEGPDVGGPYGPYVQSQRLEHYRAAADRLLGQGDAYECWCAPQGLEAVRAAQARNKLPPKYDRRCRSETGRAEARREAQAEGRGPVVRFKTPLSGEITLHDAIHGETTVGLATLAAFGVTVRHERLERFWIEPSPGPSPGRVEVESDASAASYFFAAPAIAGGRVCVESIARGSIQGDIGFLALLERMGCRVSDRGSGVVVCCDGVPRGIDVDLADMPDTAQTLAAIAPFASGPSSATSPAHSMPSTVPTPPREPCTWPLVMPRSARFSPQAWTLTRTSAPLGEGFATSAMAGPLAPYT
jgi:hypothetical protein